jgi:hypothetical protein
MAAGEQRRRLAGGPSEPGRSRKGAGCCPPSRRARQAGHAVPMPVPRRGPARRGVPDAAHSLQAAATPAGWREPAGQPQAAVFSLRQQYVDTDRPGLACGGNQPGQIVAPPRPLAKASDRLFIDLDHGGVRPVAFRRPGSLIGAEQPISRRLERSVSKQVNANEADEKQHSQYRFGIFR